MSLGMSFARRRMMAAAKKEPKYVWAVYDFAYVLDEENAITGTASLYGTRNHMMASTYTVDASGFTLVNPTSTRTSNFKVGQYLVDVSNANNTDVSGPYLYQITKLSNLQASLITVNYTQYSVKLAKGDTELLRVESDTLDYPVDGEYNGLWYVMVKGERTAYVWDEFNTVQATMWILQEKAASSTANTFFKDMGIGYGTKIKDGNESTSQKVIIEDMQLYPLNGLSSSDVSTIVNFLKGKYFQQGTAEMNSIYYDAQSGSYDSTYAMFNIWAKSSYSRKRGTGTGKGEATGAIKESFDENAYPQDGLQGNYWYTYSGSYLKEFDNR